MGYVDQTLGHNEVVLYRARFPWFVTAGAWTLLVSAFLVAAYAYKDNYVGLAVAIIVVGLVGFAGIMYPIWTTSITVTSQRFTYRRGLFARATHDLQLRAVEEVNLQQGILARLFDCGRLDLHGTGVDNIQLPLLADPAGLRRALQDGIAATGSPTTRLLPVDAAVA